MMEGHLKWIRELVPVSDKTDDELRSFCVKLLKGNKSKDARKKDDWNEWSTISAKKLNAAAISIFTGDMEKAELKLNKIDELLRNKILMKGATEIQFEIILYCRDVLRWQIEGAVDLSERTRLNRKWDDLMGMEDFKGKEVEASISFFKGVLGRKLKIKDNVIKDYFLEAHQLEPKCLAWCNHAYRTVHRIRVNRNRPVPSQQEKDLAKRAYKLCNDGENPMAAADYGLMLKEMFKNKNEKYWKDNHDRYLECVEVLEKASKSAQGHCLMKIKIYLAEFLYFGKGPQEGKAKGREMFTEMEREYPDSLAVLHKVGKMYRMEWNFIRARQCYKRALELEPTVMPCIMDYLKLLKYVEDQAEIFRVIKKALSPEYVISDKDSGRLGNELRLASVRRSVADLDNNWRR